MIESLLKQINIIYKKYVMALKYSRDTGIVYSLHVFHVWCLSKFLDTFQNLFLAQAPSLCQAIGITFQSFILYFVSNRAIGVDLEPLK